MSLRAGIVAATLLLGACSGAPVQEQEPAPLPKFTAAARLVKLWSADTGAATKQRVLLQPVIAGERVVVADREGQITAYALADGRQLWRVQRELPLSGGIGVLGDTLLLGTLKGEVLCLAAADGAERWRAQVSSELIAPPRGEGDLVLAQTVDGKLFALAAGDGKQRWMQERGEPALTLRGTSTPALDGSAVYAAFASGKLVSLARSDGAARWEATLAEPRGRDEVERLIDSDTPPLRAGEAVFAGAYRGKTAALQAANGNLIWARDISTYLALDHDDARVYVVDDQGNVLALDVNGGATQWKQDKLQRRDLSAPRVFANYIAVGDGEGYVHLMRRDSGEFVARYRLGDAIAAQPLAHADRLIVLDRDGELAVLQVKGDTKPAG